MLTQIETKDFTLLAPFAQAMPQYMGLRAIVEGNCPHAIAYLDTLSESAVISLNSRLYLIGEAPFAETLQRYILPLMHQKYPYAVLHFHPENLASLIPKALHAHEPREFPRLSLKLDKPPGYFELSSDYQLVEVNAALLADSSLENQASLVEECCSERPSVDDFLAKSFGLCLIKDGALVGWCLSEYNNKQGCEVGIEIQAPYQKQGLGAALASAFAHFAQARGVKRIGWHSWKGNLASVELAKKIGFELLTEESVYVLKL